MLKILTLYEKNGKIKVENKNQHKEGKLSMYKSIQQFNEEVIKNVEKIFMKFFTILTGRK